MNTYIAIKPFIAQQIIEMLKKLPYTEVCGLIGEINDAMNYPVQLSWKTEEETKSQRKIGFIQPQEDEEEGEIEYPEDEPICPVCVCKRKRK